MFHFSLDMAGRPRLTLKRIATLKTNAEEQQAPKALPNDRCHGCQLNLLLDTERCVHHSLFRHICWGGPSDESIPSFQANIPDPNSLWCSIYDLKGRFLLRDVTWRSGGELSLCGASMQPPFCLVLPSPSEPENSAYHSFLSFRVFLTVT